MTARPDQTGRTIPKPLWNQTWNQPGTLSSHARVPTRAGQGQGQGQGWVRDRVLVRVRDWVRAPLVGVGVGVGGVVVVGVGRLLPRLLVLLLVLWVLPANLPRCMSQAASVPRGPSGRDPRRL